MKKYSFSHLGLNYLVDNQSQETIYIGENSKDPRSLLALAWLAEGNEPYPVGFLVNWQQVRVKRNLLLQQSDFTQLPDVELSNKQEWLVYRQTLRDITTSYNHPHEVVWPDKPA